MSTAQMTTSDTAVESRDALADRLVQSAKGTWDIFTVHLGDQLGFYSALSDNGSMTASELASRTGTNERYVREWLEQQTVAGILAVEDAKEDAKERRFCLPAGHEEVLADRDNLNYLTSPNRGRRGESPRPGARGVPERRRSSVRGIRT